MADDRQYSVFIAEDEAMAREVLIECITSRPELKLAGIAKNGKEAYDRLTADEFDLIFLDINLPLLSGIELLESLPKKPYVIFTTGFEKYALKAFDLGAVDYLHKPFSAERFGQAIDKFLSIRANEQTGIAPQQIGLSFREKGKHYVVPFADIAYLSSHGKHTVIHTEERDFETPGTMKEVQGRLQDDLFVRIHKQFIVNVRIVSHIEYNIGGQYIAHLKDRDETSLPVGRSYAAELKRRLSI